MTKTQALKAAAVCQRRLNEAEKKATEAAQARDNALGEARAQGATYAELETATGLSTARVTQVLRRFRQTMAAAVANT